MTSCEDKVEDNHKLTLKLLFKFITDNKKIKNFVIVYIVSNAANKTFNILSITFLEKSI